MALERSDFVNVRAKLKRSTRLITRHKHNRLTLSISVVVSAETLNVLAVHGWIVGVSVQSDVPELVIELDLKTLGLDLKVLSLCSLHACLIVL